jgi:hypothetical protein
MPPGRAWHETRATREHVDLTRAATRTATDETVSGHAVIFIDVDGVLNGDGQPDDTDCLYPFGHEELMRANYLVLSRQRVLRFAVLVEQSCAMVVLSSSWRLDPVPRAALLAAFEEVGIASRVHPTDTSDLVGVSDGVYPAGVRADEIQEWLERHGNIDRWIALDDMPMAAQAPELLTGHFVCTEASEGLTEADAFEARSLLESGGLMRVSCA